MKSKIVEVSAFPDIRVNASPSNLYAVIHLRNKRDPKQKVRVLLDEDEFFKLVVAVRETFSEMREDERGDA